MSTIPALLQETTRARKPVSPTGARMYYAGVAVLLLVLMFLGFQKF